MTTPVRTPPANALSGTRITELGGAVCGVAGVLDGLQSRGDAASFCTSLTELEWSISPCHRARTSHSPVAEAGKLSSKLLAASVWTKCVSVAPPPGGM